MRKTMHLSMLEDGAYTRLLDWYYANDRAIPHDRRYAVSRATSSSERTAVDAVLGEFFVATEGEHRNERADAEIAAAAKRIAAAKANGGKGGRKPNPKPDGNPLGSDPLTQQQSSLSPYSLRSEEKEANASSSADAAPVLKAVPPACPQERIRTLYAEILPSLPKAKLWGNARQAALRARWGEMTKLRGWLTADDGVEWFRRFFEAVSEDDWLMGRSKRAAGHEGWECSIDYLLSPKGFCKVVEGTGRKEAA
jgi:uncharacterized protein YdaU (DUF1376 family)